MLKKTLLVVIMVIVGLLAMYRIVNAKTLEYGWSKNYGGTGDYDGFQKVCAVKDGYVVVGQTNSTDISGLTLKGGQDGIIVKYDLNGNMVWQKSYGGSGGARFSSIVSNGNSFIVIGDYNNDAIIVKYDLNGEIIWEKSYGGSEGECFYDVCNVADGYIAVGLTCSNDIPGIDFKGILDAIIVKYDLNGEVVWQKNYGGSTNEYFISAVVTNDAIVAVGLSSSQDIIGTDHGEESDAIIVKYDLNGNILWQKNYGGSSFEMFRDVISTNDGFIVVGETSSTDIIGLPLENDYNYEIAIIVKYDLSGNVVWQKGYGEKEINRFNGIDVLQDGCIVAGIEDRKDAIIVKYDFTGNVVWKKTYGTTAGDSFSDIIVVDEGYIAVGNNSNSAHIAKLGFYNNINSSSSENGTYEVDKTKATQNEIVTITLRPSNNYKLKSIIGVETTKVNDTTYKFKMPDNDVTLSVDFELIDEKNDKDETPKTGIKPLNIWSVTLLVSLIVFVGAKYKF